MIQLSTRSQSLTHFLAMEIFERAKHLESQGQHVVHLEIGEPDFPTVDAAVVAGRAAIDEGRTRYTHSLGIEALREAIAKRYAGEYGVDVSPERVVVTIGSSAALLLAFAALLDPGDEIIVADPGYPCYPNIALALGARVRRVEVRAENGFVLDPDDVRRVITPRTKAIVVNSPANPTGTVTGADVLEAICSLGPALVSDEIYHGLVYDGVAHCALEIHDEAIVVGGFSKRYAMTGWRVGYLVVPDGMRRAIQALQQNLFISASDFAQWGALAALDAREDAEAMRLQFDQRRRYLIEALPSVGLAVPVRPSGAFYVFADARAHTGDSMGLALDILDEAKVAVTPGIDFGPHGEGFLRLAYATSMANLQEAMTRLAGYFEARNERTSYRQLR